MNAKVLKANPLGVNQYTVRSGPDTNPGGARTSTMTLPPHTEGIHASLGIAPIKSPMPGQTARKTEGWGADLGTVCSK